MPLGKHYSVHGILWIKRYSLTLTHKSGVNPSDLLGNEAVTRWHVVWVKRLREVGFCDRDETVHSLSAAGVVYSRSLAKMRLGVFHYSRSTHVRRRSIHLSSNSVVKYWGPNETAGYILCIRQFTPRSSKSSAGCIMNARELHVLQLHAYILRHEFPYSLASLNVGSKTVSYGKSEWNASNPNSSVPQCKRMSTFTGSTRNKTPTGARQMHLEIIRSGRLKNHQKRQNPA